MTLSKQSQYFIAVAHAAEAFNALLLQARSKIPPSEAGLDTLRRKLTAVADAAKIVERKPRRTAT